MTSSVPAVKAALVALLAEALPDTQVIYGPLSSVTTTGPRVLSVGRAVGRRELDSLALDTAAEIYRVELVTSASLAGTDQTTADELALADYAAAEAAIREHPGGADLGLAADGVLSALPTGEFVLSEKSDDNGRQAAVSFGVAVYAQTT